MNPWSILAAALATLLVLSIFMTCAIVLVSTIQAWQEWKIEKRARILELEGRDAEI